MLGKLFKLGSRPSQNPSGDNDSGLSNTLRPILGSISHVLGEGDLAAEDGLAMQHARSQFGTPVDIPWLQGRHDGYPLCLTMSEYWKARRADAHQMPRDDVALWTSAITFGLLEAATRMHIPETLLLARGRQDGEIVLSGSRVLQLLVRWYLRLRRSSPTAYSSDVKDAHLQHGRDIAQLLERALRSLDDECGPDSFLKRADFGHDERRDFICAVALTVVPLCAIAEKLWSAVPEVKSVAARLREDRTRPFFAVVVSACKARMQREGWCPYAVASRFSGILMDLTLMSYFASLKPSPDRNPGGHTECTHGACVWYTITDATTYLPRHVDPSCKCDYVKPPIHEVERLLSEGLVPAVIFDGRDFRVMRAADNSYVSISHVWADGMGSTTEDGLPKCIVTRIAGLVRPLLPVSGAFWMDSLCVPRRRDLRKRAIKLMAETYRNAAKVLVIDEGIRRECSVGASWVDNLLRIAISGWMRRVWTLQEGLLARELWFEFVEGAVDVEEQTGAKRKLEAPSRSDLLSPQNPWTPSVQFPVPPHGLPFYVVPLLYLRVNKATRDIAFHEVLDQLYARTTSKIEDELLAVATLLPPHIHVDALLVIAGPDFAQWRMRALFLQLREVPKGFPMSPSMPRLPMEGFRWAPRTLLRATRMSSRYGTGTCTEKGLLAEYFVARLEPPLNVRAEQNSFETEIDPRSLPGLFRLTVNVEHCVALESTASIDTLVFLEEDLISDMSVRCAAACAGTGGGHDGKEDPRRLGYVGTCLLRYAPRRVKRISVDVPVLGELNKSWVLLQ
ncbi:hypothetical protein C8Q78DRAFT_1035136 [Trametes maxima]|nr:hypothetical protein C8Q78DRAFT_1035136 [Trametes maxima]